MSANLRHGDDAKIATAYDSRAREYLAVAGTLAQMDARDIATIEGWRNSINGILLDAGCGPGHWTELLASGRRHALGIDLSADFIASARARYPGIDFEVGSVRRLPFPDGALGGILAWYSLIHTEPTDLPEILWEFRRTLTPGGSILLGFFAGESWQPFAHAVAPAFFWAPEALAEIVREAGFEVLSSETRERTPDEVSVRPHGALVARAR